MNYITVSAIATTVIITLMALKLRSTNKALLSRLRKLEEWRKEIEDSIVRSVMEENKEALFADKVLKTHLTLIKDGGYQHHPANAMAEARKLHGLKP